MSGYIEYLVSSFAVNLSPGSNDSIKLLKGYINCKSPDLFYTNAIFFLDYKWDQLIPYMKLHCLLYYLFAFLIIFQVVAYPESLVIQLLLILFAFLYLAFDIYQCFC